MSYTTPCPFYPFTQDCLYGKVAIITGGGSGIGFEISRQLVIAGCAGVVICGRREAFLQQACNLLERSNPTTTTGSSKKSKKCRILYQVCDVRDAKQCQDVITTTADEFARLDIVVNGAAGNFLVPAEQLSPKGFATVMSIDTLGTYNICHAAYPLLSALKRNNNNNSIEDSGIIINISATLQYGATWWQCHASAAKAAIDSLTRSLALEWGGTVGGTRRSVRVVGIAPGPIANTPGTTKLAPRTDSSTTTNNNNTDDNDNLVTALVETRIPLGRMGTTTEIAYTVLFLCLSQYITGHTIVVDGGEWLYREPLVPRDLVTQLSRSIESRSRSQAPTIPTTLNQSTTMSSSSSTKGPSIPSTL